MTSSIPPARAVLAPLVVLLAAGLVLVAVEAGAQAPKTPPADALRFETSVLVTPERGEAPTLLVPASTVVLEARTIPLLPAVRASELVSFLPGFQFLQAEAYASGPPIASARGFFGGGEAEYLLLLVDGVPIADAESGLIDWSLVPTSSIRRIEASRGPGASMYGDAAIGGVIQVLTDRPVDSGRATVSGGSFASMLGDGAYGRRVSAMDVLFSGSVLHSAGASAHSERTEFVVAGSVAGRLHDMPWQWSVGGNDRSRDDSGVRSNTQFQTDPFGSDPLFRFDRVDRNGFNSAFTIARNGAAWQHRGRVHATTRNEGLVRTILLAPGLGDRQARDLSTATVGSSVETGRPFHWGPRTASIRFGLDLSHEHADMAYRPVDGSGTRGAVAGTTLGRRLRAGSFVLTNWDVASRVRLSGSVRWDGIDDDFNGVSSSASHDAWSPRAGVTVLVNRAKSVTLYSQFSRAFKAPTVSQLFDPRPYPDFRGGSFTISNSRLVPQRVTNVEAGISGGSRFRWSALAYRMSARNEIDFDIRTFSYANIGESRHAGVEIEGAATWWNRVQPSLSYAYARVSETGLDTQLKNVPRHAVHAAVHVDLPWTLSVFARYRHTTGAFLDDANVFPVEGPSSLDLRVRWRIGRQAFFVDAMNLTDDRYQEYGYTLSDFRGRPVQYSYPGPPRAVRAGLTLAF